MVASSLWQRAHASGQCPPSLLGTEETIVDDDGFAENVLKVVVEEEKGRSNPGGSTRRSGLFAFAASFLRVF